jgi:SAM-dependent methyltransferase
MPASHQVNIGLALCTPVPLVPGPLGPRLAPVTTEWHRARMSLATPTNINTINVVLDGLEVGDARNRAAAAVLAHEPRPEFLFFLDYDVIPQHDALTKLLYRARHFPGHDIFAGVYCCKSSPPEPLVYKGDGKGPFWDWSIGDLITDGVTGVHMGLTLIRSSLLARMADGSDEPLFKTVNTQSLDATGLHTSRGTEDLWFCRRAIEEFGARILVDTGVLAGHINNGSGQMFGLPKDSKPAMGAKWIDPDADYKALGKAIDLGAGATRREWPDLKTFTTDLRDDVGADYVQDTRKLTLPDDHFDLVASSHHLEHIPRAEQPEVWAEIFRICKPGGTTEHVIPNIAWAAAKIGDSEEDGHVMNVLYGAQEAQGYERNLNTHYFGYTPAIAQAFAERAGFEDVVVKTFKDDPALGYNLIVTGRKPVSIEVTPVCVAEADAETREGESC